MRARGVGHRRPRLLTAGTAPLPSQHRPGLSFMLTRRKVLDAGGVQRAASSKRSSSPLCGLYARWTERARVRTAASRLAACLALSLRRALHTPIAPHRACKHAAAGAVHRMAAPLRCPSGWPRSVLPRGGSKVTAACCSHAAAPGPWPAARRRRCWGCMCWRCARARACARRRPSVSAGRVPRRACACAAFAVRRSLGARERLALALHSISPAL